MKKIKRLLTGISFLVFITGCDKDFERINTNPQAITQINDPGMLLTNVLRNTSTGGDWFAESTIIQQFVLPYNLGATTGYNFNDNNPGLNGAPWGVYTGTIRTTVALMDYIKNDPNRINLYNIARIWKAYHYMWLVDHYGDIPYSAAENAQTSAVFFPKYDKASAVYEDLHKEIKEATDALDPAKDNNSKFDIFVPATATAATEITLWKRLGYSLLLRLGMRYTKADANKAKAIVLEAYNGGVMQTNADNVYIRNTTDAGTPDPNYTNGRMNTIRTQNPFNYYLAEPFVNTLKNLGDPRLKFISGYYAPAPEKAPNNSTPDTISSHQFGFPVGIDVANFPTTHPSYRPPVGSGWSFSQPNFNVVANTTTPSLMITNAQTKLLLAEAAFRGFLAGLPGALTAQQYYEAGIIASMDGYAVFPNTIPITTAEKTGYLLNTGVAYNATDALKLINTQYWIECFNNGYEGWCNWRRSGYPVLSPNLFNNNLNGGFIRRFSYPISEQTNNAANYQAAVAGLGGPDFLTTRIFWDLP